MTTTTTAQTIESKIPQNAARPASTSRVMNSNTSLLLNDPDLIWQVRSGSIALFSIQIVDGVPRGRRKHLFTVKAGEMMFPSEAVLEYQILAVCLEETVLNPIKTTVFCREMVKSPLKAIAKIESWVSHLGLTLSRVLPIVSPTMILTCGIIDAGEVFQPMQGQLTWTRILQGEVTFLGLETIPITSAESYLPLSSHLWLQAQTIAEIDLVAPFEIRHSELFLAGLQHLQTMVLNALQAMEQQTNQQEIDRIQAQKRLNEQLMQKTLSDLSSVFHPSKHKQKRDRWVMTERTAKTEEEALLWAAQEVGKRLGIPIRRTYAFGGFTAGCRLDRCDRARISDSHSSSGIA